MTAFLRQLWFWISYLKVKMRLFEIMRLFCKKPVLLT